MSLLNVFERMAQKVRDELRGEGEWEGHPATERGEYTTRYLEGYLQGVTDCSYEASRAERLPGGPACGRCKHWVRDFFVDGAGLCKRMIGAESSRLKDRSDFTESVKWAMDHMRAADDKCKRFSEIGGGE